MECEEIKFIFLHIPGRATHFFHRCCSAWIPLVKSHQQQIRHHRMNFSACKFFCPLSCLSIYHKIFMIVVYIYIYIYIFIIQRVKTRAIPCPHQPPARVDNTVSVARGGTATCTVYRSILKFSGLVWFVWFYGISTFVGYLTPNPFLCK